MSRDDFSVKISRLLQKIPFKFFRFLEYSILLFTGKKKKEKVIILLALPRSGSTLTYQILTHSLKLIYLSNLGSLLYQLPLIGGGISKLKCSKYFSDFKSNQGLVKGICGPAEGLRFWSYWAGMGLNERDNQFTKKNVDSKKKYLRRVFASLSSSENPIVTGYLGHVLSISSLQSMFPNAIFVRLKRNPLTNALSILKIRQHSIHSERSWFSIFPIECSSSINSGLYSEVASQVYWLNRRIEENINIENTHYISYEKLCANPNGELGKLIKFCNAKGFQLDIKNILPETFPIKKIDMNNSDIKKLLFEFNSLEKRHGKLKFKNEL